MVLLFSLFFTVWCSAQTPSFQPIGSAPCYVRVLLDEKQIGDPTLWEIKTKSKLRIYDPTNEDNHMVRKSIHISALRGLEVIDNSKQKFVSSVSAVRIDAKDHLINVNGVDYQGSLYVVQDKTRLMLINSVDLEDYIATVLRTESYPGWPLEMNRVMAITCRTYVLHNIVAAEKAVRWYHVRATNAHQTYRGYHEPEPAVKQAVVESQGLFLTHKDQPILAMYDICCGGIEPAKSVGFNKKEHPYLGRPGCAYCKVSPYCQKFKVYEWNVRSSIAAIEAAVKKEVPSLKKLSMITITKDRAGVAQKVKFKASSGNHELPVKKFSTALKQAQIGKLKSPYFSLVVDNGKVLMEGKGFGHCLGLCQWGAREMVRRGYDHKNIFAFYYPGCSIARLDRATNA